MTEDEARAWLAANFDVSRGTWDKLEKFVAILQREMTAQNLIAESTQPHVWARHIVDSAQLLKFVPNSGDGSWIDLGAGAGLPGVIIACLSSWPTLLIEVRRKRVDFLTSVIAELNLPNARVFGGKVEAVPRQSAAVISARAYAPLPKLLQSAYHLSNEKSLWVLPKGRNAQNELELVKSSWQAVFHVEPSVTDADSAIVIARSVKPAAKRKQSA